MLLIRRIIEKISHAHSYDNSELNDLFSDLIIRKPITLAQRFKRKMKYAFKTLIYFFTIFVLVFNGTAYASNPHSTMLTISTFAFFSPLALMLLIVIFHVFGSVFELLASLYKRFAPKMKHKPTQADIENDNGYIPPPLPKKKDDA